MKKLQCFIQTAKGEIPQWYSSQIQQTTMLWSESKYTQSVKPTRGVISTFSWGANFFSFFNATGLVKNWKKNSTLYVVIWRYS